MAQEESNHTPADRRRELRGVFCAFLGAACWGFSATCVSWLTTFTDANVLWLANMRLLIAGGLFLTFALIYKRDRLKKLFSSPALMGQLVLFTIVGVLILQVSYMSAIKHTNPGTALLLQESGVAFVLIYTCLRNRRLPVAVETISLILACVGIVLIATQGDVRTLDISPEGLIWGIISGVAMAGYNIIPVRLIDEVGLTAMNGVALTLGGICMTPFVQPWNGQVHLDAAGWLVFFGVVIVGTIIAYAVYLRGVADAGSVKASLIGVFEPISGAIIAALWLGTVFTSWDFIGGAAIILMMILVAKSS